MSDEFTFESLEDVGVIDGEAVDRLSKDLQAFLNERGIMPDLTGWLTLCGAFLGFAEQMAQKITEVETGKHICPACLTNKTLHMLADVLEFDIEDHREKLH